MNTLTAHWMVCLVGLSAATGCAASSDEVRNIELELESPCPPFRCANSPEVIAYGMHEANLFGMKNKQGLALRTSKGGRAALFLHGKAHEMWFEKGHLFAKGPYGLLSGQGLVGAELEMLRYGEPLFNIRIETVRDIPFQIGDPELVEVYKLNWYKAGSYPIIFHKNVCNGPIGSYPYDGNELLGMDKDETLFFTGDRIDADALTMSPDPGNAWFNFGCAGHTLAKLFLTRSTTASAWKPTQDRRSNQAMLKMLTADYCGSGTPMTVSGTQVRWRNHFLDFAISPSGIEAKWTDEGAICVSEMRLEANPSPDFLNPREALTKACKVQACSNDAETWKPDNKVFVVSGNP